MFLMRSMSLLHCTLVHNYLAHLATPYVMYKYSTDASTVV